MKLNPATSFSSVPRKASAPSLLWQALAQADVLFVGESESFLAQGGMMNLVKDHASVRFEVNSDALDRSHIHFSTKILALARSGYGSPPPSTSAPPLDGQRRLQHDTPPSYPELAGRMHLTGTAQVQAVVNPDGSVKEVKIIGGHPVLADALARAVMQWTYQPSAKETIEVVKFTFNPLANLCSPILASFLKIFFRSAPTSAILNPG